jgi:uncharacterized protein (DUF342 family)
MSFTGDINIQISDDGMAAYLTIHPSPQVRNLEVQELLTKELLDSILDSYGVRFGILQDRLIALVERMNSHPEVMRDLLIAKGIPPKQACPPVLVYHPKIRELDPLFLSPESNRSDPAHQSSSQGAEISEKGQIDFREKSSFLIVHKHMVLAVRRPAKEGAFGTNVRGDMVPYTTQDIGTLEPGSNVVEQEDKYISQVDGRFVWNSSSFGVSTVLEIAGDIGYKTGNIRFPGNLLLKGKVQDRFKIWLGGSMKTAGTLDCWDVYIAGSLEVPEGIIGRGSAQLRTKGDIHAKFIENCNVDTLGTIHVATGILNSNIYCNSDLHTGDRGRIVGGAIMVRNTLDVFQLGNGVGVHTQVHLGLDFVVARKLDHFRAKQKEASLAKQEIASQLEQVRSKKLQDLYESFAVQEEEANVQIDQLLPHLVVNPEARILVRGTLFPGTTIHIAGLDFQVTKNYSRVMVSIDGKTKLIQATPLSTTH